MIIGAFKRVYDFDRVSSNCYGRKTPEYLEKLSKISNRDIVITTLVSWLISIILIGIAVGSFAAMNACDNNLALVLPLAHLAAFSIISSFVTLPIAISIPILLSMTPEARRVVAANQEGAGFPLTEGKKV